MDNSQHAQSLNQSLTLRAKPLTINECSSEAFDYVEKSVRNSASSSVFGKPSETGERFSGIKPRAGLINQPYSMYQFTRNDEM